VTTYEGGVIPQFNQPSGLVQWRIYTHTSKIGF